MNKKIRIDVIVNIIRTIVLTLLSFITFPWICRCLGDTGMGVYTWANTFVMYFLILAKIGIPNIAVRECVKVKNDKEKFSNKVQSFFLLQLIATVFSFIFLLIVVFSVSELREIKSIIFILSINFLVGAFSFEWVFIALEKQFFMSVRTIIALTLCSILVIVFVSYESDIILYSLIAVLVTVITTIANLFYVRKFVSFKKTMPYHLKEYAKPLVVLCAMSLSLSLYNQTDTFILGFLDTKDISVANQVASYSVGIKGIDIIIGIFTALSTVFIPRAAYYYQLEDKKYYKNLTKYSMNICLFIVLPAVVTMSVLAKPICGLISGGYDFSNPEASYSNAPIVLVILSSMMITYTISEIIYEQILLPSKKEKNYLIALLGGTILNLVLSILFGKYFTINNIHQPAVGVAIGTIVTDVLILLFMAKVSWKWLKHTIFNKNTLKLIGANLIILALSLVLYNPLLSLFSSFSLSEDIKYGLLLISIVFIDAIVYIVFLWIIKEDLVYSFSKKKRLERKEIERSY